MSPLEISCLKALVGEATAHTQSAVAVLDDTRANVEDCETPDGRALWVAVESLIRDGQKIDALALVPKVPQVAREVIFDIVLNSEIACAYPRLRLFHESATRRRYLEALRTVAKMVTETSNPLALGVAEAQRLLSVWQDESDAVQSMDASVLPLIEELEAVQLGKKEPTLKTGLDSWDAIIGGLQPTLTVVGALPGVGKSALVAGLCRLIGSRGVKIGLVSLEDERGWLTRRLLSCAARVPVFALANTKLSQSQLDRVGEAAPEIHKILGHVLCDDRSGLTVSDIIASARRMVASGCKAIIIDHLGEISLERTSRHDLDISDALRDLRVIAKTARIPVVVLAHIKRRDGLTAESEPRLSDFAFSAGVERMARVAVGLWRDGDELRATVMKQTQGVAGVSFTLCVDTQSGVVIESPASGEARKIYAAD